MHHQSICRYGQLINEKVLNLLLSASDKEYLWGPLAAEIGTTYRLGGIHHRPPIIAKTNGIIDTNHNRIRPNLVNTFSSHQGVLRLITITCFTPFPLG